jgi:HemY protein
MIALPNRFKGWREDKREQRALAALQTATIALQEGRFAHAEKAAKIAARKPSAAALAALLGASSAHSRSDQVTANEWLNQLDAHPEFADSKILQQAHMALDNNDTASALTLLNSVSPNLRKHSLRYKELLIQAQAQSNNWHEVKQLATERKTTITTGQKSEWMKRAIAGLSSDESLSADYLRKLYKDMPDDVRDDDSSIQTLVQAFIQRQAYADARLVIQESMRNRWRPALLPDYVRAAQNESITDQLKMCNAWQAQGHNDVALHTTAGQLCVRAQVWGQAKKHFEEAIKMQASAVVYSGLAQALYGMGDKEAAQNAEHQASKMNELQVLTS